jgi:DNA modification methylase
MTYLLAQASAHRLPLRDESVQCVVTSPPYWGLRAYSGEQSFVWGGEAEHAHEWGERILSDRADAARTASGGATEGHGTFERGRGAFCPCGAWFGALGLEPTPDLYVEHMVEVFREVRRVLRPDGTLWLNLGDSYAANRSYQVPDSKHVDVGNSSVTSVPFGLKPKDLVGIPWRVAFALQADGWYLRSDIVWSKANPMPESVTDRPTKSHEYLFLLTKNERYYYDADAIREVGTSGPSDIRKMREGLDRYGGKSLTNADPLNAANASTHIGQKRGVGDPDAGRNARTVWTIATQPYPGAHFATFPEAIPERCIKAGTAAQACAVCGAPWERVTSSRGKSPEYAPLAIEGSGALEERGIHRNMGGRYQKWLDANPTQTTGWRPTCAHDAGTSSSVILDPFNGSGTTGRVALRLGRRYVGLDLSREYLSEQALRRVDPLAAAARDARVDGEGAQGVFGGLL